MATVLEATLVAVARKIIAFEPGEHALERGLSLGIASGPPIRTLLMLAVSVGWFLLGRPRGPAVRGDRGSVADRPS